MTASKDESLKPVKPSARDKAAMTDETARTIIASEVTEREKKTARLRALRMQQEPAEAEVAPAAKPRKRARAKTA